VSTLRVRLSALAIIAVIVVTNGAVLFAAEQHDACAMVHHDCERTPTIRPCCCDGHTSSNQGAPVESRVQVGADVSAVPLVLASVTPTDAHHLSVHVHTSPPRIVPLDLPTLFAALLI